MYTDCFPCLARGTLDAARLATPDESVQLDILRTVLEKLARLDPACPPPLVARMIYQTIEARTGVSDPYGQLKKTNNRMAMDLYPWLQSLKSDTGRDRFDTAVRLAVAGNIIDFATAAEVGRSLLMETISHALNMPVNGDVALFKQAVESAETIVWLADNAGEIVFDKLLLEEMDCSKVVYVVRGGAVQNDATLEDARETGLAEMVRVISSGAAIPGTLLPECSPELNQAFGEADLVISKGQGNFETLPQDDSRIFFLFKAKCPVVARHGNCRMGDVVVRQMGTVPPVQNPSKLL